MPLSVIENHYWKHKENLRLERRHGIVEYETTMHHLHHFLEEVTQKNGKQDILIYDIGAGTGRYTSALMAEGYKVKAVELVQHNIDIFRKQEPTADVVKGNAKSMPFIDDNSADITLLLGPLYHLIGEEEKLQALREARRITKVGGLIFVAYLMNEYSVLSFCFDKDRISSLMEQGVVDEHYHVQPEKNELYDYVRLEDINSLNEKAQLHRVTIFSPDGAADYMRTRLNYMSDQTFKHFIQYQISVSERMELLGAGSHVVDVLRKE